MSEVTVSGGDKWEGIVQGLIGAMQSCHLEVGILEGVSYSGTAKKESSARAAHFSAKAKENPAKAGELEARAAAHAAKAKAKPDSAGTATSLTTLEVGFFHEFGTRRTPERSFIRRAKTEHLSEWIDKLKGHLASRFKSGALLVNPKAELEAALRALGHAAVKNMRGYINDSLLAPLKPRTIKEKLMLGRADNATVPLARWSPLGKSIQGEVKEGPI